MVRKLNLCCGNNIKLNWDNADIQKHKSIIYCDINKFPFPFKDNTYNYILMKASFVYAQHPLKLMMELRRITRNNGIIELSENHYYNGNISSINLGFNTLLSGNTFKHYIKCVNGEHDCYLDNEKKFELINTKYNSTKIGKLIYPFWLRERISHMIGGIISGISVKLRVIKEDLK